MSCRMSTGARYFVVTCPMDAYVDGTFQVYAPVVTGLLILVELKGTVGRMKTDTVLLTTLVMAMNPEISACIFTALPTEGWGIAA